MEKLSHLPVWVWLVLGTIWSLSIFQVWSGLVRSRVWARYGYAEKGDASYWLYFGTWAVIGAGIPFFLILACFE